MGLEYYLNRYAKREDGSEFYINTQDPEKIYIKNESRGYLYRKNYFGNECYAHTRDYVIAARDAEGNHKYARHRNDDEYYWEWIEKGNVVFKNKHGEYIYAKTAEKEEIYPSDNSGSQFVLNKRYARSVFNSPKYPKDRENNEYVEKTLGYITIGSFKIYPISALGLPLYPQSHNGDEIYLSHEGQYSIGTNTFGESIYAQKFDGTEYYPPDGTVAYHDNRVIPKYARTKERKVVFPKTYDGSEYYFKNVNTGDDEVQGDEYAKDALMNEFYPRMSTGFEFIVGKMYAKDKDGREFYPLDENGNEYTKNYLNDGDVPIEYLPIGYPISSDGYFIVDGHNSAPYYDKVDINVKKENIVRKLERTKGRLEKDYLTNVRSERKSRSVKGKFMLLIFDRKKTRSCLWTIVILTTLLGILIIVSWCFIRKMREN